MQRGRYLVSVDGARLLGRNGLVVLPDGSYAAESLYVSRLLEKEPDYYAPKRRRRVTKPGSYFPVMIVHFASPGNHYHWLHDTLTRLHGVVERVPSDTKYIVSPDMNETQRETLRFVGISDAEMITFDYDEEWELESLQFAPPAMWSGSDILEVDHWLRDAIFDATGITPAATGRRRIFVSRRNAAQRRIVNEGAVEKLLQAYGFETYTTEDLSFRDQVALFADASVVVSTHGAGLTNTLFSPRGATVVEIIEPTMFDNIYIYWAMAEALGHEYWYVLGESLPRRGRQHDTVVPIEKLAATLEAMDLETSR